MATTEFTSIYSCYKRILNITTRRNRYICRRIVSFQTLDSGENLQAHKDHKGEIFGIVEAAEIVDIVHHRGQK
ncbi:MAG: hypothetical protein P8017_16655 [Deltaproteobacteria bacterium]